MAGLAVGAVLLACVMEVDGAWGKKKEDEGDMKWVRGPRFDCVGLGSRERKGQGQEGGNQISRMTTDDTAMEDTSRSHRPLASPLAVWKEGGLHAPHPSL